MLNQLTPRRAALVIFLVALATIAGAWIFEAYGYAPCPLCLKQRWAYYVAIPVALVIALMAGEGVPYVRRGLILLGLIWIGSAIFGAYHAGVEWKFWPGPTSCSGGLGDGGLLPDLTKTVVSCEDAALRILGLSLAGWNAVISAVLAWVAFTGARR